MILLAYEAANEPVRDLAVPGARVPRVPTCDLHVRDAATILQDLSPSYFISSVACNGTSERDMTLLVPAVVVVFLALKELHICSGKPSSITTAVDVYVDTILEVNGESRVPPVFGIT